VHIQIEQSVQHIKYDGTQVSIVEVAQAFYTKSLTAEQVERLHSVPMKDEAKTYYANKLAQ